MCVFMDGWPKKGSLTSARLSRESLLSILAQRPHKEMCLCEPAILEKDKGVGF